ncbi:MAG: PAS domain-containing sensor histidine kinase [Syntrophorhabdales bacterium]|jgi:PAS domain S-box-containing protein
MDDEQKTKRQLIKELNFLREKVARLKESERKYRKLERVSQRAKEVLTAILENAPYGVGLCKGAFGRILYQNPEFTKITGYTIEDLRTVRIWLPKAYPDREYRRDVVRRWKGLRISGRANAVLKVTCKDGSVKDIELRTVTLPDGRTVNTFSDITRQERAEAAVRKVQEELESRVEQRTLELLEVNRQLRVQIATREKVEQELKDSRGQLRSLSEHLQSAREEERKRIAREVHDELGQALSVLKIDVKCLRDAVGDNGTLQNQIDGIAEGLDVTVQSVRRICTELRPAILDHFGLPAAIEWQAKEFERRTGIECYVNLEPEEMDLDHDFSMAVFRMFQETLTNVVRHAGADWVRVMLVKDSGTLSLRVIDNGRGITKKEISNPRSFGIMGMVERARFWGGTVGFEGRLGKGTTVTVNIPVR